MIIESKKLRVNLIAGQWLFLKWYKNRSTFVLMCTVLHTTSYQNLKSVQLFWCLLWIGDKYFWINIVYRVKVILLSQLSYCLWWLASCQNVRKSATLNYKQPKVGPQLMIISLQWPSSTNKTVEKLKFYDWTINESQNHLIDVTATVTHTCRWDADCWCRCVSHLCRFYY